MKKVKYAVCYKKNGYVIDEFTTREKAEKALARYEEYDKQEGFNEEDLYEVIDWRTNDDNSRDDISCCTDNECGSGDNRGKKMKRVIKEVDYKGHKITLFDDEFGQRFAIIDQNDQKLYDSLNDAKRVIRGEQPKFEII